MDYEHTLHPLNAIRTLRASQNQDANAAAIDLMLIHLKGLLKKYLTMKKICKQLNQCETEMSEEEVNERINIINDQIKNITLAFDKVIPPDKRMTNLLYMRILKEISYFEKIIPSFLEIIPSIQNLYNEQVRSDNFSIFALYSICEKKFVQQIKINRLKVLHILEEKKMKFIIQKIHFQHSIIQKQNDLLLQKKYGIEWQTQKRITLSDFNKNIIEAVLDKFVEKKSQNKKVVKSLNEIVLRGTSSIVLQDYKERVAPIFQHIYSPLDIINVDIVAFFTPTLRPDDNIELIYRKVSSRNKKSKKQIKQFQAELSLYQLKKEEHLKRKIRKFQIRHNKIQSSIVQWSSNAAKTNQKGEKILQGVSSEQEKKYSFNTIDLLKPIKQNQKQRSISRFRQRFQESLQNAKSVSTTTSHFRPNNLAPIVARHTQDGLQIKIKKKRASQLQSKEKKDKENDEDDSSKKVKKQKKSKSKKFQIKNIQQRGKSLKNAPNKQFANKKLRL